MTSSPAAGTASSAPRTTESEPILRLAGITRRFDSFVAVDDINLDVRDGEFLTIVGPSGSGKTTLLRMLAGMERPSDGQILLRGNNINNLPPNRRPTCLVFQSLALFPHRTVGQNIEFPLKIKGVAPAERKKRALELMALMRLPADYYLKNVMKCSGGEKQRVALARAFAYDPEILFFDEPLSALDYKLKKALEKELKDIHKETGKTFVYITHSLEEAMVMSDRIGVMKAGRMVQVGTPADIYSRPHDRFVAEFMGEVNVFAVKRRKDGLYQCDDPATAFRVARPPSGSSAFIVVRPEFLRLAEDGATLENTVEGTIHNQYSLGSRMQYRVRVGERILVVETPRTWPENLVPGSSVRVGWNPADAIVVES